MIMARPAKSKKKDTTKARAAKGSTTAAKKPTSSATEAKKTRPRPKPAYKGATAEPDADERVASAALMMLGHDRATKTSAGDDEDIEELMDDEDEEDGMEEVEGDGLTNEVQGFWDLDNVEGEEHSGNDDDTSCEYGSSHFIEKILTL
jgi:hypothetical protein